jgi:6-pyruvoyltetrahydropterin/6-carboxytetrahydropterin synthase
VAREKNQQRLDASLWSKEKGRAMRIRFERRYGFSAAHLYRRPEWSDEKNARHFGKCAWEPGHGHNYRLWVVVLGEPDAETGFVVDLPGLDEVVRDRILEALDHRHINHAVKEFAAGKWIPSSENLLRWIHGRLQGRLPGGVELVELRLYEDESLGASWRREDQPAG